MGSFDGYTQVDVLTQLLNRLPEEPKRILDLCASPGGKTLLLADRFPHAELVANDLSNHKLKRLQENLSSYGVQAEVSCGPGERYRSGEPFDLIVIDAPCSNSGTFNRRAEARWRFSPLALQELEKTQRALVRNAHKNLSSTGHLIYLTCSICPQENDNIVVGLPKVGPSICHLPNSSGWDGGFGCLVGKD